MHLYQLKEQEALVVEENNLPIKIVCQNGFHYSKPLYITKHSAENILIGIGCEADNGRFWAAFY
ncbi:MAG: hypothetical protein WDM90_16255 [Ferruginibacter sp.]